MAARAHRLLFATGFGLIGALVTLFSSPGQKTLRGGTAFALFFIYCGYVALSIGKHDKLEISWVEMTALGGIAGAIIAALFVPSALSAVTGLGIGLALGAIADRWVLHVSP